MNFLSALRRPSATPSLSQPAAARPLVEHRLLRELVNQPDEIRGLAFDYLVAGDGVYAAAWSDLFYATVPIAACQIRGLMPVNGAVFGLMHGRVPWQLWDELMLVLDGARVTGCEALVAIEYDSKCGYQLVLPEQDAREWSVAFKPQDGLLLEVHSHREAAAKFSLTDTQDEQRLRLYGVVGRLDQERPHVNIRCGVYGHFMPLAWSSVFDGDPTVVRDVNDPLSRLAR
jgi:hypothetical protein